MKKLIISLTVAATLGSSFSSAADLGGSIVTGAAVAAIAVGGIFVSLTNPSDTYSKYQIANENRKKRIAQQTIYNQHAETVAYELTKNDGPALRQHYAFYQEEYRRVEYLYGPALTYNEYVNILKAQPPTPYIIDRGFGQSADTYIPAYPLQSYVLRRLSDVRAEAEDRLREANGEPPLDRY